MPNPHRGPRGFTLVEILIACALFAILIIGITNFMLRGQESTKQMLEKGDNLRDTRLTLAFMEKDIREGHGIVQFKEDDNLISFSVKRVTELLPADVAKMEYITYNFIKKETTIDGKTLAPGSLTRGVSAEAPAEGFQTAAQILIHSKVDNRNGNIIGLIPKGEKKMPDDSLLPFESKIALHDKGYDIGFIDRADLTPDQREQADILHTYKAKKNAIEGYQDVEKTVCVQIKIAMGDGNKNIEFFHTVVYMRCMMLGRSKI